jgi:hypothetical protein
VRRQRVNPNRLGGRGRPASGYPGLANNSRLGRSLALPATRSWFESDRFERYLLAIPPPGDDKSTQRFSQIDPRP